MSSIRGRTSSWKARRDPESSLTCLIRATTRTSSSPVLTADKATTTTTQATGRRIATREKPGGLFAVQRPVEAGVVLEQEVEADQVVHREGRAGRADLGVS